jgi:hypothetical protein
VGLVPISEKHLEYAREVKAKLEAAGLRVELDERNDVMKAKIRDFATAKVPFILILGDKEVANDGVSVRTRGIGAQPMMPLSDFIAEATTRIHRRSSNLGEILPWKDAVRNVVQQLTQDEFFLDDVYDYEYEFASAYPKNRHIKEKIRQQLQVLRDEGLIEFVNNDGRYRKLSHPPQ